MTTTYVGAASVAAGAASSGPSHGTLILGSGGYGATGSTQPANTVITSPTNSVTQDDPVSLWLQSPAARQYEGKWVVLDNQCNVVDVADGPEAFAPAVVATSGNTVLFVLPSGVRISG